MDRLFLDANVLFSAAYHPGAGLLRLYFTIRCSPSHPTTPTKQTDYSLHLTVYTNMLQSYLVWGTDHVPQSHAPPPRSP